MTAIVAALALALQTVWLGVLAMRWEGPQGAWLLGPDHRLMVEPWRLYMPLRGPFVAVAIEGMLAWILWRCLKRSDDAEGPSALRVLTAMAVAACAFLAMEIGVRAYEDRYRPVDMAYMIPDPVLAWRIGSPSEVNDLGLRNPPMEAARAAHEFRVLCVGDSCTFGVGVPIEASYPALLERWLQQRLPQRKVVVLNAGVPGYSSLQGLLYLVQRGLALQPDLVIWAFAQNDSVSSTRADRDVLGAGTGSALRLSSLLSASHFYLFLRSQLLASASPAEGSQGSVLRVPADDAAAVFAEAVARCRAAGARVALLQMPDRAVLDPAFQQTRPDIPWLKYCNQERVAEEAAKLGVPVVDPRALFAPDRDRLFLDIVHLNAEGYRKFVDAVGEALMKDGLTPRP